jgi:hypothetical protein
MIEMPKRWLALSTSKDSVTVVDGQIPDDDNDPIVIVMDDSWRVQKGNRATAYSVLHQQCADYVRENRIDAVFVKASAVMGRGSAKLGLLTGAEVRGVVMAASGALCQTSELSKAVISKTYGDRKVDEYCADDAFWAGKTTGGDLRKLSRETAMLLVAARNA